MKSQEIADGQEDRKENLWGEDYHGRLSKEDIAKMDDGELTDGLNWHCTALNELASLLADLGAEGKESPALGIFGCILAENHSRANIISAYADEMMGRLCQVRKAKAA